MNYTAVFPSNRIGDNGITPYWFSLDCILDDLNVYDNSLGSNQISKIYSNVDISKLAAPDISPRHLPRVESTGEFQACWSGCGYCGDF